MHLTDQELEKIRQFFSTQPVLKAYLFGSYARGEADETSDIDLLVDLDRSQPIGWEFYSWSDTLEALLCKKVDLGTPESIVSFYRPFIEADQTVIYEKQDGRQAAA